MLALLREWQRSSTLPRVLYVTRSSLISNPNDFLFIFTRFGSQTRFGSFTVELI